MLKIEMLPAGHGDCLWIEYGHPPRPRRVLIDGGAAGTYKRALLPKLLTLPEHERAFELLLITHIDADHITGVLDLLQDKSSGFQAREIWFNGFRHLPGEAPDTMGAVQGEKLTTLLVKPGVRWNTTFARGAVVVPPDGPLPRVELPGGLVLTVLSPTRKALAELKPEWEREVGKAGLDPTVAPRGNVESLEGFELLGVPDVEGLATQPFVEDSAKANGSSVAVLAEFEGRSLLLTGDAHPSILAEAIRRIRPERLDSRGRLPIDACKLPHHASKANVSRALLDTLACKQYLFSTNGAYFQHPDPQAVARVIKWGGKQPALAFNYRSKHNEAWAGKLLRERHGYTVAYPGADSEGLALEWK